MKMIRLIYNIKMRILLWYCSWRYKWLWECFDTIDKYYDHTNPKEAAKHIIKWAKFRKQESFDAERYRREALSLKTILLMSGMSHEAIESSDWAERCFGVNTLTSVVPEKLGYEVIDYICKAGLVQVDKDEVFVWSANAPSQLRMFIMDTLFYNQSRKE